jgi:hypothetical protein
MIRLRTAAGLNFEAEWLRRGHLNRTAVHDLDTKHAWAGRVEPTALQT